jgi:Nitrate/nitrite transporter
MRHHPRHSVDVFRLVARNWRVVTIGILMTVFTTTSFYLITAYTPTFGKQALHLAPSDTFVVTLCVGLANLFWLPVGGALSDRIGRQPILVAVTVLALLSAYPAMSWLVAAPSFSRLLAVELLLSLYFGMYNGAMVPLLVEIMPPEVRTAAFAFAYSLATAIFGGFTPAICTWLIERTGNRAAPALWLSLAAAISLAGALLSRAVAQVASRQELAQVRAA